MNLINLMTKLFLYYNLGMMHIGNVMKIHLMQQILFFSHKFVTYWKFSF